MGLAAGSGAGPVAGGRDHGDGLPAGKGMNSVQSGLWDGSWAEIGSQALTPK